MKTILQSAIFLACLSNLASAEEASAVMDKAEATTAQSAPDLKIEFGKVSRKSIFQSDTQSIWRGSVVKGVDGLYHMLYSRWPTNLG